MQAPEGTRLYLMAPVEVSVGQDYESLWSDIKANGYLRMRVDGETHSVEQPPNIDRRRKHRVEVIVDRVVVKSTAARGSPKSVESCVALGKGVLHVVCEQPDCSRDSMGNCSAQPAPGV